MHMAVFNLPELGEGLSEGEIVAWKVKEGDVIKADQALAEVMTDKATIEIPSPRAGKITKLYYTVGSIAKVGKPLVDFDADAGAQTETKKEPTRIEANVVREASTGAAVMAPMAAAGSSTAKVLASPAVRKAAREMGVDLTGVPGSGDRGRVLRTDLERGSSVPARASSVAALTIAEREERKPFIGIRRKIAESLSRSMFTAVHFTHHDEADFTEIMKLRDEANAYSEKHLDGTRVTYLPFYIKAAIASLKHYPILNSELDEKKNEIVIKHYYHFGISVQTDNGLMVAVVRDCDRKDIFQIARDIRSTVDRARTGKASLLDLTGSTITITNVGNIGGLHATPVINYPEASILGMYQIKKRPVVKTVNGVDEIVIRPMMYVNITCDHRIVDGAIAAGFLREVCDYIENPGRMAFY